MHCISCVSTHDILLGTQPERTFVVLGFLRCFILILGVHIFLCILLYFMFFILCILLYFMYFILCIFWGKGEEWDFVRVMLFFKNLIVWLICRVLFSFQDYRKGTHLYLSEHSYKNTSTEDLWAALSKASAKPIEAIMNTWTKQLGFPVIKVGNCWESGVVLHIAFGFICKLLRKNFRSLRLGLRIIKLALFSLRLFCELVCCLNGKKKRLVYFIWSDEKSEETVSVFFRFLLPWFLCCVWWRRDVLLFRWAKKLTETNAF